MQQYDFYHATDARRHGIGVLVWVHVVILAFCGILYLFHTLGMKLDGGFLYCMGGIGALVYAGFLVYELILTIKGGQWVFAICDGELRVTSPAKVVGETFSLRIADIVSITQEISGGEEDYSSRLFIVSKDGEEHDITQNACLDWEKLFAKLEELNPDIRKEYNTPSDVFGTFLPR